MPRPSENNKPKRPPAQSPKARENQLIALAVNLAEKQLIEGTASAQVVTHFLKLGTERETLEREKLSKENELLRAKTDAIASAKDVAELYKEALRAMNTYRGTPDA